MMNKPPQPSLFSEKHMALARFMMRVYKDIELDKRPDNLDFGQLLFLTGDTTAILAMPTIKGQAKFFPVRVTIWMDGNSYHMLSPRPLKFEQALLKCFEHDVQKMHFNGILSFYSEHPEYEPDDDNFAIDHGEGDESENL